jgi:short-subunit dehydrogenase
MKKVLITGASDGLGFEVAKKLIDKGVEVVSLSRRKPRYKDIGFIKTDLSKESSIRKAVDVIKRKHKDFDALINCAGIINIKELGKIDYGESERLLKINTLAPMILSSELIGLIRNNEADIINVGSTVGLKAYKDQAAYGVSKWGIRGLNEYLRLELKDTKSRVIGFMPGGFKSRFVQKYTKTDADLSAYMDPADLAKFLVQIFELPKTLEVSEVIINRKLK